MRIVVNGEPRDVTDGVSVSAVVASVVVETRGVAVALDGEVVPKSAWDSTVVAPAQSLEILKAVQGG